MGIDVHFSVATAVLYDGNYKVWQKEFCGDGQSFGGMYCGGNQRCSMQLAEIRNRAALYNFHMDSKCVEDPNIVASFELPFGLVFTTSCRSGSMYDRQWKSCVVNDRYNVKQTNVTDLLSNCDIMTMVSVAISCSLVNVSSKKIVKEFPVNDLEMAVSCMRGRWSLTKSVCTHQADCCQLSSLDSHSRKNLMQCDGLPDDVLASTSASSTLPG